MLHAPAMRGYADGDPVGTWSDLSGKGNNATQSTAGKKPSYQTNEINGWPVVRFDGSNDYLNNPYTGPGANFTFLVVSKSTTDKLSQSQIRFQTSAYVVYPWTNNGTASPVAIDANNGATAGLATGFTTTFTVNSYVSTASSTNGRQSYTNGSLNAQGNTGAGELVDTLYIGASGFFATEYFSGDIASLLIFSRNISPALRQRIQQSSGFTFRIATK